MSSDHRIACGEASTTTQRQRDNNTTTNSSKSMHSVRGTSDIDVTLISPYCLRSVLRLHPQTPKRVSGQPASQNGSKSNVSHKEIKCKLVLSFFWKSTPPNRMRPDEAARGHLASSGLIWRHLASSGVIWPHLVLFGV